MVKRRDLFVLFLLLFFGSCTQPTKEKTVSREEGISVEEYSQCQYERNVLQFLKNQKIDVEEIKDVIFLNSSTCKSCILQVLSSLSPFLSKTKNETLLYVNDSILINTCVVKNPKIRFCYFERDFYEANHVIHNAPYLYRINAKRIMSIKLKTEVVDSLNMMGGFKD